MHQSCRLGIRVDISRTVSHHEQSCRCIDTAHCNNCPSLFTYTSYLLSSYLSTLYHIFIRHHHQLHHHSFQHPPLPSLPHLAVMMALVSLEEDMDLAVMDAAHQRVARVVQEVESLVKEVVSVAYLVFILYLLILYESIFLYISCAPFSYLLYLLYILFSSQTVYDRIHVNAKVGFFWQWKVRQGMQLE